MVEWGGGEYGLISYRMVGVGLCMDIDVDSRHSLDASSSSSGRVGWRGKASKVR